MKKYITAFFLFLIVLTPFIELANASLLRGNFFIGNIGQIYKGVIILIALVLLSKKQRSIYLSALGVSTVFALIHYFFGPTHSFSILANDLLFIIKITYLIPLTFILSQVEKSFVYIASTIAWLTIVANILLGILGYGYTQYALGYGYKGFFFSGNEMALTLMITSAILLYFMYRQKKVVPIVLFSFILMILGPLEGMKTLIIGLPLIVVLTPLILHKDYLVTLSKRVSNKTAITLGGIVALVAVVSLVLLNTISPQFFVRFGEITQRSGIVGAILSERNKYLSTGLHHYVSTFSVQEQIFGVGSIPSQHVITQSPIELKTIEMDFFDLLLSFGLLAFVYFAVWVAFISSFAKHTGKTSSFLAFLNILLFALSVLTGHVIYSTFLITYWAMTNALLPKNKTTKIFFMGSVASGGISVYMKETVKHAKKLEIEILPTHVSGAMYKTVFAFIKSYFILTGNLITHTIYGNKTVLHLHMATNGSFIRKVIVLFTASWFADKTILHLHSGESVRFFDKVMSIPVIGKLLLSLVLNIPDNVIVVSETLCGEIMEELNRHCVAISREKWIVLPNAVDVPKHPHVIKPFTVGETLKIVTVSRLHKVKNLTIIPIIAAFLKRKNINFSIEIAGDGPDKARIERAIKEEGVRDVVTLVGNIPHDKIGEFYKNAQIFLLPSTHESFGIVVLEAYVYGLLAIASDVGGLKDIVVSDKTGYRFNPANPEAFAAKIASLTQKDTTVNELRANAQDFVKQFDYKDHIKKLSTIINS